MIDYTLGYELALNIVTILVVLMLIFSVSVVKRVFENEGMLKTILVGLLALVVIPICVYFVFFPILFTVTNFLNQDVLKISFWKEELSNGVFAIRVASCILSFKFISIFIELIRQNNLFERSLKKCQIEERNAINDIESLSEDQATLLLKKDLSFLSTLQFAFYLACVTSLWFSIVSGESSMVVMLTSWCLFYIIDDWSIISEYSREHRVMPMGSHKKKVNIFNCLLFLGSSASLFVSESWMQAISMFLILLFFGIALAMYYWRASKVVAKFA
ncbi:hypothetical protein [Vibrio splendidus]|uniref:hypothetical protein n=1 Tax=Vibrio splendidus TaxID=29497 RepID=UPI001C06CF6B|nr:hypothetical protein [Vibrio splendidus]MBU2907797.1 hypothetical protein [Vibrio splendidus]MDO6530264.1 hypothetical protein [Vibrio splendidus]MDO6551319.1 hypothetical protein [Vibrio splendidus]